MRCRRRRTSSSTDAQLIEHQSRSSPSGPFTTAVPWRPTCPSVLGSSVIVASTGPPDPRQHPFGSGHRPVSGQLCETAGGGASHVSWVPVAFWLPAFAFRVILCPLGDWAFLAVGLPGNARTPSGFHVSHARAATGLGALSTPGTAVLTRPTFAPRPPPAAFNGNVPAPRSNLHHPGLSITRHHRGFTCVHPSGLPLACSPRMERAPLSFSPELRTRRHQRRTSGWGQALSTGLRLRRRRHVMTPTLLSASPFATCDLVSHADLGIHARAHRARPG